MKEKLKKIMKRFSEMTSKNENLGWVFSSGMILCALTARIVFIPFVPLAMLALVWFALCSLNDFNFKGAITFACGLLVMQLLLCLI